jgi:hypothetical protein
MVTSRSLASIALLGPERLVDGCERTIVVTATAPGAVCERRYLGPGCPCSPAALLACGQATGGQPRDK